MRLPYREKGDALEGERIACQARKIINKPPRHGSSCHKIQAITLESNAYCIIEKSFRVTNQV